MLLHAYARKALRASWSAEELGAALRREISHIVDGILPERSPRMEASLLPLLPAAYVASPHRCDGEWEEFMPQRVRALESPDDRKEVRAALTQTLEDQAPHLEDQFRQQESASGSVPSELPTKPRSSDPSSAAPQAPSAKGRRRGPSPDYQTAARVAAIVAPFRPQWRRPSERLDLVLQALEEGAGDQEKIPMPKTWGKHGIHNWADAGLTAQTRSLAKKRSSITWI